MRISEDIVNFVAKWEGYRETAYKTPGDRWTVGYGQTYINGTAVIEGQTLPEPQARKYLQQDLQNIVNFLAEHAPKATQQQLEAVASLCYNVGLSAFCRSATYQLFVEGANIADRFLLWDKFNGKSSKGLHNRREAERALYLTNNTSKGV